MTDLRRTIIPILLLGDSEAEKSSLVLRLTGNKFDESSLTTIGKESYIYETILHDQNIKIKIWDSAGQERFKSMSANVIKCVEGIILVYSITSRDSFENLSSWLNIIKDVTDICKIPIIIVGNKAGLEDYRKVSKEEGENFAKSHGFHFFEVSAKTGMNVKAAFDDIFELLYKKLEDEITGKKEPKSKALLTNKSKKKKSKCQ